MTKFSQGSKIQHWCCTTTKKYILYFLKIYRTFWGEHLIFLKTSKYFTYTKHLYFLQYTYAAYLCHRYRCYSDKFLLQDPTFSRFFLTTRHTQQQNSNQIQSIEHSRAWMDCQLSYIYMYILTLVNCLKVKLGPGCSKTIFILSTELKIQTLKTNC